MNTLFNWVIVNGLDILISLTVLVLTAWVMQKHTQKIMRASLLTVGVAMMLFRVAPGTEIDLEGMAIVSTLLIPVVVVLVLMGLLLDSLMARVMRDEQKVSNDINRYAMASKLNLLIVAIMVVEWIPNFQAI